MSKDFNKFLDSFSQTNVKLSDFTDFDKVRTNVKKIELQLNQLNYLLGQSDIEQAIYDVYQANPKCFEVLEVLIAVRSKDKKRVLTEDNKVVEISSYLSSVDGIIEFIRQTGLEQVFRDRNIKNLVDYVFGVEVGLDSNSRKNRGGSNMSAVITSIFDKENIFYKKEVKSTLFSDIQSLGADKKHFDFVVKTKKKTYLIEVNYYNGGGSKLNETARSFTELADKINQYSNYEFVWITDGQGWYTAKNKLEEAYYAIPSVYSLATLIDFIQQVKQEGIITSW
ncbi:type II restriction endonuclease [Pelistega ratti]|uniref:type II restriction endonuclease n=1 Tax=Pelistega ratti TaxID=2652177 RepID=UPI00135A7CF5|nr:type II restriction endonuclease [Pelistega ratti]